MPAALGLFVGAVLLFSGAVQLVAALSAVEGQAILWELRRGHLVSPDDLGRAADRLGLADRVYMQGDRESDRGFALLRQAELMTVGPYRDEIVAEATAATERSLASAPGNPAAWARLAYLYALDDRRDAAARAIRMSFLSGPIVPVMQASRLSLGLRLLPHLDQQTVEMLRRQVRFTWLATPDALVPIADDPRFGPFVRRSLSELDDADMENFVRRYSPMP
ncbi:hypothetical protein T8K17_25455 (plasmid) [Thalassobaculum sp. OXR-137]|uniref:hypothetical protein n=1 Tax=Thalassobaculum sp. OXR-137 TaxID=3100173 RepID=UPI002AC9EFEF|nr:hypothetical protein [Thalassobaculum sp. OXR-137]WPZ37232.1 hypothetical protein T8K17_25455 [Thalassobaculum sp. OXR-137]